MRGKSSVMAAMAALAAAGMASVGGAIARPASRPAPRRRQGHGLRVLHGLYEGLYPHSSDRQDAKHWVEHRHPVTGFVTIGRAPSVRA